MRLEEAKEIIKSESLEDYNINLDHEIEAGEIGLPMTNSMLLNSTR